MEHDINKFIKYIESIINLTDESYAQPYNSLSVCLIDCIYSLRAKYFAVTIPIINRYAKKYMNGNKYSSGDNLKELIQHIDDCGGTELFAKNILKNMQVIGGERKSSVLYTLSNYLLCMGINTIDDFKNFKYPKLLELVIHAVKGMGDAGTNYLFMLAGNDDRCKPDVHIHHCIRDALGYDLTNDQCQELMKDVVTILNSKYKNMTVKKLDGLIWYYYQGK